MKILNFHELQCGLNILMDLGSYYIILLGVFGNTFHSFVFSRGILALFSLLEERKGCMFSMLLWYKLYISCDNVF